MNMNKISESGIITENGQLRLPMDRINAFFAANKGKRVVVKFEAAEPGSSELQLAYYYNYIVPTVSAALYGQGTRMSERAVDRWLVEQYPGEKDSGISGFDVMEARQMDTRQMSDYLNWLKQFAAENLYVYIEEPRTL